MRVLTLGRPPEQGAKRDLSLTDQAYARLRQEIITCQLPPGSEISELDLAERLGMSKTPVREALGRLNVEGLVETYPRRGYRITPVTLKDIADTFAVRCVLERTAAALAAEAMSDVSLDVLSELANVYYSVNETRSLQDFVDANTRFHAAIAAGSGNPRLHNLVVIQLKESERYHYLGARARDINVETNRDHHGIVDVLRRRDAQEAGRIMAEHIENTRDGLNRSFLANAATFSVTL